MNNRSIELEGKKEQIGARTSNFQWETRPTNEPAELKSTAGAECVYFYPVTDGFCSSLGNSGQSKWIVGHGCKKGLTWFQTQKKRASSVSQKLSHDFKKRQTVRRAPAEVFQEVDSLKLSSSFRSFCDVIQQPFSKTESLIQQKGYQSSLKSLTERKEKRPQVGTLIF